MNPSEHPSPRANEFLCLVTIAVLVVLAAITALAITTRVVVLIGALGLLLLALAAVIREVVRLASDDEPHTPPPAS